MNESLPPGFVLNESLPSGFVLNEPEPELGAVTDPNDPRLGYPSLSEIGEDVKSGAAGFAKSFQDPIYGAMDYFDVDMGDSGFTNKESRARSLAASEEEADKSMAGTVGEVGGTMAQFMLPGAMAAKAVRGATGVASALPLALDTAGAALRGSAVTPEGSQSRLSNAVKEAGYSLAGAGAGKVLKGALGGLAKKKGVSEFFDQGGYLTPGQATRGGAITGLETVAEVTPFLGKGVGEMKDKAAKSVAKSFMSKVGNKFGASIDDGGHAGFRKLKDSVNAGYDDAWSEAQKLGAKDLDGFNKRIENQLDLWPEKESKSLKRLGFDIAEKDLSPKQIDRRIRKMIEGTDDYEFRQMLQEVHEDLRNIAGPKVRDKLAKLDSSYPDFITVQDAARKSRGGEFDARTLETSMRKIGGNKAAKGTAPMQEITENIAESMENVGGQPLDFFRRVARFAPTPIPRTVMEKAGNMLIGETVPQREMAKRMASLIAESPELAEAFRRSTAAAGATYGGEN